MEFDKQGHIVWTPKEVYQMVLADPRRLVNGYLMSGTPWAFADYARYWEFIEAVADRIGIHPKNIYLRGSCQVSFSIAPKEKVWTEMHDRSDLDLAIVDAPYFDRFDQEVRRWEARNPAEFLQGTASEAFFNRQRDRRFNCCRDESLPSVVCVPHQDAMAAVAKMKHCGLFRKVSAFIYPDWHSAQRRYEYDLRCLRDGIEGGWLAPPGDSPFPAKTRGARAAVPQPGPIASAPNASSADQCDRCGGELKRPSLGFSNRCPTCDPSAF
jgi:hypothetical protein